MIICMTCGIITELPYLRWALYEPLREALGQNNTQFGMSMSLFGLLAAILWMAGRPDIAQKIICGIGNRMWNPWNLAFHDAIFFFDNDNPRFMGDYQYRDVLARHD